MVSRVCRGFCTCVLVSTVIYASIVHHANAQQEKANNQATIKELIDAPLIDPALPWQQLQKYVGDRIPEFQTPEELADWKDQAKQLRQDMLEKVVFRGEARQWRKTPGRVEWFDKIETGEGYRIKKFRYQLAVFMNT